MSRFTLERNCSKLAGAADPLSRERRTRYGIEHIGMTEAHAERQIVIVNDLTEITTVIGEFESFAASCAVPPDVISRFCLIFDEMLSNIIFYGFPDQGRHEIDIAMARQGARLSVTITDDGIPFDPLGAVTPNMELPIEEREIAGLGIHLVRNLVHGARYRREDGRNIITLIQELN